MLDGGFFATALAFVGIVPARQLPPDPEKVGPRPFEASPRLPGLDLAANPITRLNSIERPQNSLKRVQTHIPLPPADTAAFVSWLRENNEFGEMAKRRLLTLYSEFCENAFEPISTGRLMRQLRECGVVKRRLAPKHINGKYHSPTVYRVLPSALRRAA